MTKKVAKPKAEEFIKESLAKGASVYLMKNGSMTATPTTSFNVRLTETKFQGALKRINEGGVHAHRRSTYRVAKTYSEVFVAPEDGSVRCLKMTYSGHWADDNWLLLAINETKIPQSMNSCVDAFVTVMTEERDAFKMTYDAEAIFLRSVDENDEANFELHMAIRSEGAYAGAIEMMSNLLAP